MRARWLTVLILAALVLCACAPGVNELVRRPSSDGLIAGFWLGTRVDKASN